MQVASPSLNESLFKYLRFAQIHYLSQTNHEDKSCSRDIVEEGDGI